MSKTRLHPDEIPTDVALVRRLLASQFPEWSDLPIAALPSPGTDHAIYRLGSELLVRLPCRQSAAEQVEKEQRWLAALAPYLPLPIPTALGRGRATRDFPWSWSVYPWLEGQTAVEQPPSRPNEAAVTLARFVAALRAVDPTGGPAPGNHNFHRAVPLASRDTITRGSIASLKGKLDETAAITAAWEQALDAPPSSAPCTWVHGDLNPRNLLVVGGRLSAVIDFGGLAVGDPACDLAVAWSLFRPEAREVFRSELHVDDASWTRGRGWALSIALVALPYYWNTNPVIVREALHVIDEVLAERKSTP